MVPPEFVRQPGHLTFVCESLWLSWFDSTALEVRAGRGTSAVYVRDNCGRLLTESCDVNDQR